MPPRDCQEDRSLIREHIRTVVCDGGLEVQVLSIEWPHPHEPRGVWRPAATVPADDSKALELAIQTILNDAEYFQVCEDCGARKQVGRMLDDPPICHACAERNHGVAF